MFLSLKKFTLVLSLVLGLSSPLLASFGPNYDHRPAVGKITTGYGSGSATLVQGDLLASAAHVFPEFYPNKKHLNKASGPVVIDLRNKGVTWEFRQTVNGKPTHVPVLSMVVDAAYIHAHNEKYFSDEAEKNDVVFLKLDPHYKPAKVPTIPLIDYLPRLPQMCAAFGYGEGHGFGAIDRDFFVHRLEVQDPIYERDGLHLDNSDNTPHGNQVAARAEVRHLLHDPAIDMREVLVADYNANPDNAGEPHLEAINGDSGGPLFVTSPEGVRLIAITSNSGSGRNGFACVMSGNTKVGYSLNPYVEALLMTIGGKTNKPLVQMIQQAFNPDVYIRLNPDLAKGVQHMTKEQRRSWATQHFHSSGMYEGRVYQILPAGFNALTYLNLYNDLKQASTPLTEAKKKAWAQAHYALFGQKEQRAFGGLPNGFDPLRYLALNPDLKKGAAKMSKEQKIAFGRSHYMLNGMKEGRKF